METVMKDLEYAEVEKKVIAVLAPFKKKDRRPMTVKMLAKASGIEIDFVQQVVDGVEKCGLVYFDKSPAGRLVCLRGRKYFKEICYADWSILIDRGECIWNHRQGCTTYQYEFNGYNQAYERLRRIALEHQVPFLEGFPKRPMIAKYVLKTMGIVEKTHDDIVSNIQEDRISKSPLVKALIEAIRKEKESLETLVAREAEKNEKATKDREKYIKDIEEGRAGRWTNEPGRIIGYETTPFVGHTRTDSAWNGGNTYVEYSGGDEYPVYDTRRVWAVDKMPEPLYLEWPMRDAHTQTIRQLGEKINALIKEPEYFQERLQLKRDHEIVLGTLKTQRSSLDQEIKKREQAIQKFGEIWT